MALIYDIVKYDGKNDYLFQERQIKDHESWQDIEYQIIEYNDTDWIEL